MAHSRGPRAGRGCSSERWKAGPGYERTAAYEVIKLAEAVKPREVFETALAMFMMQELEPRRFRSDAGFRFQLVRRVRALGDVNVGEYFDHETGKMKRVYRELSPRAAAVIGQWVAEAVGAAGVHLARLEVQDEERMKAERVKLHQALEELA